MHVLPDYRSRELGLRTSETQSLIMMVKTVYGKPWFTLPFVSTCGRTRVTYRELYSYTKVALRLGKLPQQALDWNQVWLGISHYMHILLPCQLQSADPSPFYDFTGREASV